MNMNMRIREHIVSRGIKFSFVADRAGINLKKFSRMMNNKQVINTNDYEDICTKGLELDPRYFYGKEFLETKNKSA